MGTGFLGTFVISWSQIEVDGLTAAPISAIEQGAVWAWHGDAIRVDGPTELLRLERGEGETILRKRAARMVRKLVGAAVSHTTDYKSVEVDDMPDSSFVVTDGFNSFTVSVIEIEGSKPLLMFIDDIPPKDTNLWVVHQNLSLKRTLPHEPDSSNVICFAEGTLILTPHGELPVEELYEGDFLQTKDNGLQEVQWIGSRRMTGARLFALPKLRPIRIKAGALGENAPDRELVVSPEHKVLVRGRIAQDLFNTPEVFVTARELENGSTIGVDYRLREVTYYHLLMPRHEVIFANGVETESFHPADASLSSLEDDDRSRLLTLDPNFESNPYSYGDHARRNLTPSEAALLRYEAA